MIDYKNAEKILEAKDVVVKFSLRGRVLTAIREVSMDLYKGESLAIVGESGSGKSVFNKTFMGLLDGNGWFTPAVLCTMEMILQNIKQKRNGRQSGEKRLPWSFRIR